MHITYRSQAPGDFFEFIGAIWINLSIYLDTPILWYKYEINLTVNNFYHITEIVLKW